MAERKFTRGLSKPGMAAQLRETVSQVVRETTVQSKLQCAEPIDYEGILTKQRIIFNNDPHRELLLFPPEDVVQEKIKRECRTVRSTVSEEVLKSQSNNNYFTQKCAQFYISDWSAIVYKHSTYGGSYEDLPRQERLVKLVDPKHEIDVDGDVDDESFLPDVPASLEGYLLKGPEGASEKMFANIATKSFKRRFCKLRQDVTGVYYFDVCKDDKKQEITQSICLDECDEVLANKRKNKLGFQLKLSNQRSYVFAAPTELELNAWLEKLCMAVHSSKVSGTEEKRALPDVAKPESIHQNYGTLRSLEASLNPQLTKYAHETETSISLARKENRNPLFKLSTFQPSASPSDNMNVNHSKPEPLKVKFGERFLVRCESLSFKLQAPIDGEKGPLGQVEPYLTSLALYDLKLNKKITEDFHFDINQPHMKAVIQSIHEHLDPDSESLLDIPPNWLAFPKQAILNLRNRHSEIFLVVRIEAVLQGSHVASAEPYIKPNPDVKTGLKVQKTARLYSTKLGKYRMPFAWTARPLFRSSGELDTTPEFSTIYRQESNRYTEEDLIKMLNDFRKPDKMSRLTTIPGVLKIRIDHFNGSIPNSVSSSLVPIIPFPMPPAQEPTVEISEFPSSRVEDSYPFMDFTHHLYVYPKNLKYDSQKTFHRARNIACMVEVRDSDDKDAMPLKCIYGLQGELRKVTRYVCSVSHHVTTPTWMDEIKISLPTPLTNKHHVLFTFVHVSCDLGKQKKDRDGKESALPEVIVGYSWLPLLHKGRLRIESQSIPVSVHLPPGYLSFEPLGLGKGYAGPDIRWVDGQKPLFHVDLELVSTVTACDQHLHNFFLHMARLNETRSLASLFPSVVESESNKPTEEAPKSPVLQDGSRELSKLVKALHAVDITAIINYLPVILNQLSWLLIRVNNEEVSVNVLKVLVHIVNQVHEVNKSSILDSYLNFVFITPTLADLANKATFHEEMVKTLCVLLRPSNTDFLVMHKFLRHARFFLLLIARSMAQSIIDSGRIKMQRQERFNADFQKNIENLIAIISPHIQQKYKDLPEETRLANLAVADFIKKCISLMDRGFGFRLVSIYLDTFRLDDPRVLCEYKFQFLQSVCQHEHYIPLNFPRAPNWVALQKNSRELDAEFRLCEAFCRSHYLSGLLLQEVRAALNEVADVRRIAIKALKDLLAKHELDDRYQKKGHQSRISSLYLPWIFVVLDNWNRLTVLSSDCSGPYQSSTKASATASCIASPSMKSGQSLSLPRNTQPLLTSPTNSWKRNTFSAHSEISSPLRSEFNPNRNSSYLAIIAGQGTIGSSATLTNGSSMDSIGDSDSSSTMSFETPTLTESQAPDKEETGKSRSSSQEFSAFDKERRKEKHKTHSRNASTGFPIAPILRYDKLQPDEVKDVLLCLLYIVKHVEDDALIAWWHNATQHDLICYFHVLGLCLKQFKYLGKKRVQFLDSSSERKASTLPPRVAPPKFGLKPPVEVELGPARENDGVLCSLVEANLANEVGLVVLDSVGLFCMNFKDALLNDDGDNPLMRKVLDIYLSFLQVGQSETLSKHVFAALRAFINNFPVALYQGNAWLCGRLCCELLRCCASKLAVVRQESCAVLYLLMRSNFEYSGQKALTRVHLQVIVSLSQLLGEIGGLNSARFGESLCVINNFANSDKAMLSTVFPGEVRDLTKRAQTVLKATLQMRQQAQDPELLIDLQHSLANSYSATPELRKTWVETMALHHSRLGNWSEAALCHIHVAALIAEYLFRRNLRSKGCEEFNSISPNIVQDESNLRLDYGVQDTNYDECGLLEQLEESAKVVEKAERYEMLLKLYQLILPIHEQRRDFPALAACYTRLSQACTKADEVSRTGRRLLGTFYRVALYGEARFGEEAGTEYIYKEHKVTSLPEIAERLSKLYAMKFGHERVKIVMDSNPIEGNDLDPQIAYVQITHVVPYFDDDELVGRQTDFERNHNINRFMYEVPFTTDGKVRGNPEEQCKRRVILTSQYFFPYVKKRLRVLDRESIDLSPIEVALDEMRIRVKEIAEVVQSQPTDLKKLQLRLQGSISVQVNAGPLAYASAFLGSKANNYPHEQVIQLQELYRDFVHICGAALELNGKLILSDQREYHEALKNSFRELVNSLAIILEDPSYNGEWEGSVDSSVIAKRSSVLYFTAISYNGSSQA